MVQRVIEGVDRKQIPSGQYQAVLIDEGHDFAPEWLKLVTQMVDPTTNSLLVLYDDAQSIYERSRSKQFSFKSVGIQAQGRTTILKINYRNTRQILQTANLIAAELLTAEDKDEDGIPLLKPVSCGRDGEAPHHHPPAQPARRSGAWPTSSAPRTAKATPGATWPSSAATGARWTNAPACCAARPAAPGAQRRGHLRPRRRHHQGADHARQQRAGVSGGGAGGRGPHARAERRARSTRRGCFTWGPRGPRSG